MIFVLIKKGIVVNTILADQDFIDKISKDYDLILPFNKGDRYPSIGYSTNDGGQTFNSTIVEPGVTLQTQIDSLKLSIQANFDAVKVAVPSADIKQIDPK